MNNPSGPLNDAESWNAPLPRTPVWVPERELRPPPRPAVELEPAIRPPATRPPSTARATRVTSGEQLPLTFKAPQSVVASLTSVRTSGDGWSATVDGWTPPRGFLTMPGDGTMKAWRIVPPLGESLVIAFDRCDALPGAANVREFLTGGVIRVYLATLAAARR